MVSFLISLYFISQFYLHVYSAVQMEPNEYLTTHSFTDSGTSHLLMHLYALRHSAISHRLYRCSYGDLHQGVTTGDNWKQFNGINYVFRN